MKLFNKSIDEYVHSVQAKLSTVIVLHILFIGFLYPMFLYICIMVPATFVLFWKWIKITYDIETSQRNHLIGLINETEKNLKEHGDKIPEADRNKITEDIEELKLSLIHI